MTPSPLRVDHLVLPAFDAAATYRFYTEALGLPLVEALSGDDWGGKPWLMMLFSLSEGRQLVLCTLRGMTQPTEKDLPSDIRHYAFSVASEQELDSWRQRLRAYQINPREEDHGSQRSIYFKN